MPTVSGKKYLPRTNMLTCKFEDGGTGNQRHVVVDALVIDKNKILLIKRAAHLTNGGKYAFPGGFLDRDETAEQAVVREVKEETGYDANVESLFTIIDNPNRPQEDRQNVAFIYIVKPLGQTGKADSESSEVKWFSLDDLPPEKDFAFDHYQTIQEYKKKYTG